MVYRAQDAELAIEACILLAAIGKGDAALVGGKGARLGDMLRAGVSVPPGFVVSTAVYRAFMAGHELDEFVEERMAALDVHDPSALEAVADQIQRIIHSKSMPPEIVAELRFAYEQLGEGHVAVRSSATAEDLQGASFAGQYRTYLNVEGVANVVRAVRACWSSLFEARAIFYREENEIPHDDVAIAAVVQRMVPADVSGVMLTADASSGDPDALLIEAVYGLGEPLVSGELSPDAYVVDRSGLRIVRRELAVQPWKLCRNSGSDGFDEGSKQVPLPLMLQGRQKLDDERITALAQLGLQLERHYGHAQDVEWAFAGGRLYILQARPITVFVRGPASTGNGAAVTAIVSGTGASGGVVAGPFRIMRDATEIHRIQQGDVLVTEMTTPDFVSAMKRAAAIVTDRGGRTCHAAIVSREMGLPCVVGTGDATSVLRGLSVGTVDGHDGRVYEGDVATQLRRQAEQPPSVAPAATRTKLYVNLADPDAAQRVASLPVDGVGLLRAEFMIALSGEHPRAMLKSGRGAVFTDRLATGLERFASAFAPRPVVYRFSDFKTNAYRHLKGGEAHEPYESNPMIGYRGCARYLAEPDLFALEVEAVKAVRRRFPNLWIMIPFVRTAAELKGVVSLMRRQGLESGSGLKTWMMVEVPSNILMLDQFLDAGIDGVSIGSNDLTQLVLGVDRDNERLASLFDERDPAVLQAIEHVIRRCMARGVTVSICGQAPSVYPELTRMLVEWGVTSVSVTSDMIDRTRLTLHEAEETSDA